TGYKKVDTRFETLITVSNQNLHAPGGVIASPFYANALQGNITQTQSLSNLAIAGNGFFIVSRADTQNGTQTTFNALPYYTRAGDFELNRDGYLVNNGQYYLNGWEVDEDTGLPDTATLAPIQVTQVIDQPTPTGEIEFVGNLPASSDVNPQPPLGPTNIQIFDALGSPHTISLVWAKRADNIWKLEIQAPDSTLDPVDGTIVGTPDQAPTSLTTTANVAPVAQVDQVAFAGPMTSGQTATFTIGATSVTITAPLAGYSVAEASAALVAAINGNPGLAAVVTAGNIVAPGFDVVADEPGTGFTAAVTGTGGGSSSTFTANVPAVAQVDTITLAGTVGATEIGDTWTLTVGTVSVNYVNDGTETSLNDIATRFADLINANPALGVTANAVGVTIQIQANNPGVGFTSTVGATNGTTPSFIDVQFGETPATAGTVVAVNNAFNLTGNATVPGAQGADQPIDVSFVVDYGTGPQTITLNLGQFQTTNGLTQFAGSNIDVSRFTQDGVPQGLFKDLNIRDNGDVELNYDNGRSRVFFKVPLAQFFDPTGLKREVAQGFLETFDSGAPRISEAGSNGSGTLRGSAIEGSNVDIAEEFSKMIITQRSYAANTRVITTADEMLQEVINIKR
ncbi:MAG: flagellar hook-basal body complex protein, partial [Dongiaceae bacterium]